MPSASSSKPNRPIRFSQQMTDVWSQSRIRGRKLDFGKKRGKCPPPLPPSPLNTANPPFLSPSLYGLLEVFDLHSVSSSLILTLIPLTVSIFYFLGILDDAAPSTSQQHAVDDDNDYSTATTQRQTGDKHSDVCDLYPACLYLWHCDIDVFDRERPARELGTSSGCCRRQWGREKQTLGYPPLLDWKAPFWRRRRPIVLILHIPFYTVNISPPHYLIIILFFLFVVFLIDSLFIFLDENKKHVYSTLGIDSSIDVSNPDRSHLYKNLVSSTTFPFLLPHRMTLPLK